MRARLAATSLLTRFAVAALVCLLVVGGVVGVLARREVQRRELAGAQRAAELALTTAVRPSLTRPRTHVDGTLARALRRGRLTQVEVFDAAGRLLAAEPAPRAAPPGAPVARALTTARTVTRRTPGALEVYVPLGAPGRGSIGAVEMTVPYEAGARSLLLELAAALLAAYALLIAVVSTGSRALRRQAAHDKKQALHDPLTGLANRRRFHTALREAVQGGRDDDRFAVLVIDLDRFKELNDTLGHHVGDQLLRHIGPRLRPVLRADDVLARLGGDEFAVLLRSAKDIQGAGEVAERLRAALVRPFSLERFSVHVAASIGVAIFPDHARDGDALLRRADVAMYQAKATRTGWEAYSAERDRDSRERLELVGELNRAIGRPELVLHFQPKASARTGEVVGVEALVRWEHPERGLLGPGEFLPLAEQAGLMRPLTLLVLDMAVQQCARWRDAGLRLPVSVNLSATHFLDLELPKELARVLERTSLDPALLSVEITESVLLSDPERAHELLREVSELGVKISLDDFGTGYSSLAYLSRLPVDELKVDRSFVEAMHASEQDATMVRSIVDLARNLHLSTVAEGVESQRDWDRLAAYGCDEVQGFFLSPPRLADELVAWLREREAASPSVRAA